MKVSMGRKAAMAALMMAGLFPIEDQTLETDLTILPRAGVSGDGRITFARRGTQAMHPAYMTANQRRRLCPGRDCMSKRRRG